MNITISSGHGKYVPGAIGIINEVEEARRVTNRVAELLHQMGVAVNVFHDNNSRNQRDNINTIVRHHNGQIRDLDVSVHFNAFSPTTSARGTEVLYRDSITEKELAANVSKAIANAGGLRDRGAKLRTDLGFLNLTNRPSILIEVCFVDSVEDVRLYQKNFEAICRAIAQTLSGQSYIKDLDIALKVLQTAGIINTPDHWRTQVEIGGVQFLLQNKYYQ